MYHLFVTLNPKIRSTCDFYTCSQEYLKWLQIGYSKNLDSAKMLIIKD